MVTISALAAKKAREILTAEGKSDWGLRIFAGDGGCCGPSYGMDISERPEAEDEVIEKDGTRVFMDKKTSDALNGMEIDFVDNGEQQGFVLKGGETSSCGSGCACG